MEKIVFFRVAWMNKYQGLWGDIPQGGGSYDDESKDEIYNFCERSDGYMYGYVQPVTGGRVEYSDATINLKRIDVFCDNEYSISGVTVVFVATNPIERGLFIVGWYKNAIVYRREHKIEGIGYYAKARAEDCFLIEPNQRTYKIPRATKDNKEFLGQSNVWYADSKSSLVQKFRQGVIDYIRKCR